MTHPQWSVCPCCATQRLGIEPVHGDGPCPLKIEEHEIYMQTMEAQRLYYERQAFALLDAKQTTGQMMGIMKKVMGVEEEDEDVSGS